MKTRKIKRKGRFSVYILKCKDGSYYTGYTNDLEKRIRLHNNGDGAKCLRGKRPVELVWHKEYKYFKKAVTKEIEIKELSHKEKQELVGI
ncbi:MAG: GIY-YIG nuclease family protein [Candidatus Omnitrophota bacterium]|jgi:putative endonuclease|nr:GIY-YIG nuclease family protein [Candidatus Omnitrophota bacterium]|tara:strand:+ start:276 stop:545 length:270 start_codon:yes stop_codon:yes gene_type:complete